MVQETILGRGRTGWKQEETDLLWREIKRASQNGAALRQVFDAVAQQTGRKPNSVRNYYYIAVKSGEAPDGLVCQRALPFTPFDRDELHDLVSEVLRARAQGVSVRACVTALGNGDKSKILRYQNKYRSVLKNRPEYIRAVMDELRDQGVCFDASFTPVRRKHTTVYGSPDNELAVLAQSLSKTAQGRKLVSCVTELLREADALYGDEVCTQA